MGHSHRSAVLLVAIAAGGCGAAHSPTAVRTTGVPAALLREMRPIGAGPRFQPPLRGPVHGPCRAWLGTRYGVHVEVFSANRVVIIPAGIGTAAPRRIMAGGVTRARCYGPVLTLQPTGVVLIRLPGGSGGAATRGGTMVPRLADVFRGWGEQLTRTRIASFRGGHARAFVNGRPRSGDPARIPLRRHDEVVVEIGPFVPPHSTFAFPPHL